MNEIMDVLVNHIEVITFMNHYGLLFLFLIVFLEYLNLPGFPAGVIFPVAGVWVAASDRSFLLALTVSVAAGLAGSLLIFLVGKKGGPVLLGKIKKRFPRSRSRLDGYTEKLQRHADATVFIAKLIPLARTLIGLPAGAVGMDVRRYLFFSCLGIIIWNGTLMLAGVVFGDTLFDELIQLVESF